jgi:KaiC/GvpD/RAD55 family RecA-like ATPase
MRLGIEKYASSTRKEGRMALKAKKPELLEKRLKMFVYGEAGIGKTTAAETAAWAAARTAAREAERAAARTAETAARSSASAAWAAARAAEEAASAATDLDLIVIAEWAVTDEPIECLRLDKEAK